MMMTMVAIMTMMLITAMTIAMSSDDDTHHCGPPGLANVQTRITMTMMTKMTMRIQTMTLTSSE